MKISKRTKRVLGVSVLVLILGALAISYPHLSAWYRFDIAQREIIELHEQALVEFPALADLDKFERTGVSKSNGWPVLAKQLEILETLELESKESSEVDWFEAAEQSVGWNPYIAEAAVQVYLAETEGIAEASFGAADFETITPFASDGWFKDNVFLDTFRAMDILRFLHSRIEMQLLLGMQQEAESEYFKAVEVWQRFSWQTGISGQLATQMTLGFIVNTNILEKSSEPELLLNKMAEALNSVKLDPERAIQGEMALRLHSILKSTYETAGFWEMRGWTGVLQPEYEWYQPFKHGYVISRTVADGWESEVTNLCELLGTIRKLSEGKLDFNSPTSILDMIDDVTAADGSGFRGLTGALFANVELELKKIHCQLLRLQIEKGDLSKQKDAVAEIVANLEGFEVVWDAKASNQTEEHHWQGANDNKTVQFLIVLKPDLYSRCDWVTDPHIKFIQK
ncbi:MAG: hypothetical protein L3J82_08225 [Planctomycetes bacterium]|nr:hypothetical protein [Planctomycetota bacterium]